MRHKFSHDQLVFLRWDDEPYPPVDFDLDHLVNVPLIITGIRWYQSRHFRPECYMVSYLVSPLAMEGLEHDDDRWVGEGNLRA